MSSPADGASAGFRNVLPAEGMPERLVGLAPAADVVEAVLDLVGRRRLEGESGAEHDLARIGVAAARGCLNRLSR